MVLMWWLSKRAAEEARAHLQELVDSKLEPAVVKALRERAAAIDGITTHDPSHILYANVTADYDETWTESGIAGTEDTHQFTDVRFVDIKFTTNKISESPEIDRDDSNWFGVKTIWATRRVTYSFVIFDPDYEAEKARRVRDWDEYTKKNPRWRIKGPEVKGPDPDRWVHASQEIPAFYTERERKQWEDAINQERQRREDRERAKRPRVEVIR